MVVPAPRVRRPFEELSQPFSSACSKLCNHPVDPDKSYPNFHLQTDEWVKNSGGKLFHDLKNYPFL